MKSRDFHVVSDAMLPAAGPSEGWPSSNQGLAQASKLGFRLGSGFIPCPSPKKQRMLELRVLSPGQVKPHIHPRG